MGEIVEEKHKNEKRKGPRRGAQNTEKSIHNPARSRTNVTRPIAPIPADVP